MFSQQMIGRVVGGYRLTEVLGEGGMGIVFKGVHSQLGQVVAVKMLHPQLVSDDDLRSRFLREAQALARLNHQNVVRLLSFLQEEGACFIVMEFIEGHTIDQLMRANGPIAPLRAAEYFVQVLAAMHYAHSLGIIHRDIKPPNICLLASGQIKVLDFGTAKVLDAQRLTQEGMTLGTLIYMSPEQICGRDLDHRSDIYSLGVTLYEMVTGQLPHYCDDEMVLVREIARGYPAPPSTYAPGLPKALESVIMRSIEKNPATRYQTADEFLKDLREFIDQEKARKRMETPPPDEHVGVALARGASPEPSRDHPEPRPALPSSANGEVLPTPPATRGPKVGLLLAGISTLVLFPGASAALIGLLDMVGLGIAGIVVGLLVGGSLCCLAFFGRSETAPGASAPPAAGRPGPAEITLTPEDQGATLRVASDAVSAKLPPDHPLVSGPGTAAAGAAASGSPAGLQLLPQLSVFRGPDQGRSWTLPHGGITIGRGRHNTIVINDKGVSTTHGQLSFDGKTVTLTDLQSRNGTFVNKQRVSQLTIGEADVIVMGGTRMTVTMQYG
ncbi:protein kinase [Planctomycetota bacterium]